jgi:hypothetical protein
MLVRSDSLHWKNAGRAGVDGDLHPSAGILRRRCLLLRNCVTAPVRLIGERTFRERSTRVTTPGHGPHVVISTKDAFFGHG